MFTLTFSQSWKEFNTDEPAKQQFVDGIIGYVKNARWFGSKAFEIASLRCDHCLPLDNGDCRYFLMIIEVTCIDREPEYYLVPLSQVKKDEAIAGVTLAACHDNEHVIMDAIYDVNFHKVLFAKTLSGESIPTTKGVLKFDKGLALNPEQTYLDSVNPGVDQSNSSIFFNGKYFMKIYRKLFLETNPEVDMLKFLTEEGGYKNIPAYRGSLVWERKNTPPVTLTLMMNKVEATKDNWSTTGDELNDFLHAFIVGSFSIHEFVFEHVELLAKRTAEMHKALSSETKSKNFQTEKFTPKYRNWLYEHLKSLVIGRIEMLRQNSHLLDSEASAMADFLTKKQDVILRFFERIKKTPLKSLRTRIHGDYHLGQVLYTGSDFIIIDFEGEPESSITERKIKHSPLKDVSGMIRSFHYAVSAKLFYSHETKDMDRIRLQRAADRWFYLIRETFTETYLKELGPDQMLYANKAEINFLFLLHLLEKAIYEVGYELNGRPDWLKIPLKGVEQVINELEKYEG